MTRNGWIRSVPRPELNLIHHSLRMYIEHPLITPDERLQATLLADMLWAESVIRGEREEASTS